MASCPLPSRVERRKPESDGGGSGGGLAGAGEAETGCTTGGRADEIDEARVSAGSAARVSGTVIVDRFGSSLIIEDGEARVAHARERPGPIGCLAGTRKVVGISGRRPVSVGSVTIGILVPYGRFVET